jgi:hypothetical protein
MRDQPATLRAGVARADITPPPGTQLAGDIGAPRHAREILDPLFARVILFEAGERRLCLIAVDVTLITEGCTTAIRQAAKERCGLEPEAVMVHATQTHSAPCLGHVMLDEDFDGVPPEMEWLRGGDPKYDDLAVARINEAVQQAHDNLQPATIGAGSGIEGRLAFNRRAVTREGKVFMPHSPWENNPLGPTDLLYMEGPMDPEVGVLAVRAADGNLLSVLVNYTCHPVHVFPKPVVSADWPGAVCVALEETYPACISLVINGACGNINPWPPFDPDYNFNGDHIAMGNTLAAMVRKVVDTLQFSDSGVLDYRVRRVPLQIREADAAQREADAKLLSEYSAPPWNDEAHTRISWEWMMAASRASISLLKQRDGVINYEIQVLRVGDTAFVGLPGEPFVEGQLRLKALSPVRYTYVAHCTTQYVGYLATPEAFPHGGHEVNSTYWAKVEPDALGTVVESAAGVLRDVFDLTKA